MTDKSENSSNQLPIPGLISLLLAALAVVVPPLIPLESTRPMGNSAKSHFHDIEDVNARLWQDPFAAAEQHNSNKEIIPHRKICEGLGNNKQSGLLHASNDLAFPMFNGNINIQDLSAAPQENCTKLDENNSSKTHHSIYDLAFSIAQHVHKDMNDVPPLILGAMVPGGPYAENAEQRRRTRYAVLSGLAVSGYAPEDSEHIGYFETDTNKSTQLPERIPFEWFNSIEKSKSSVLLVWLDETAFSLDPLNTVKRLKEFINLPLNNQNIPNYLFIGPNSSDTLKAMGDKVEKAAIGDKAKKDKCPKPAKSKPSAIEFEFYIADATADEKTLCIKVNELPRVLRTTLSDEVLAQKIKDELSLRGIDPVCHSHDISHCNGLPTNDNIVLISEWDTLYGRIGLPDAMTKTMVCDDNDNCNLQEVKPNWIHKFSYLRGLDGILPDETSKISEAKLNNATDKDKIKKDVIERPEGQSQKDYLRRIAERLVKLNQWLEEHDKGEIRAIGVLGSDAYDKLLVLKALRPKFPNAIFFTTDLDTRLMHPEDSDATKNLLVASSFGLQLRHELQKDIPPFRDSRQTAYFLATQVAFLNTKKVAFDQTKIDERLKARIFETGLHRYFDLSPVVDQRRGVTCEILETCWDIYPQPENSWPGWKLIGLVALFVALTLAFVSNISDGFKQRLDKCLPFNHDLIHFNQEITSETKGKSTYKVSTRLLNFLLFFALLVSGITVAEVSVGYKGEPFAWANGISLWPSMIIRLFAGVLGCFFIDWWLWKLQINKDGIPQIFNTIGEGNNNAIIDHKKSQKYYDKIASEKFVVWVLKTTGILFLLSIVLIYTFGLPHIPYRGQVSLIAYYLTLPLDMLVLLILVMMTVNTTRYCSAFIKDITQKTLDWPPKTKQQGFQCSKQDLRDIQFVANITESVKNMAYFPFIVLALMGIARSKIFDNWDMPLGLALVYLLCAGLIVGSKLYLRYKSEEARDKVVKRLENMVNISNEDSKTLDNQIEQVIARIIAIKWGAFIPFTQEPAVQALLLPLGGWGGITLLQHFSMFNAG
jgi:hypothetical protein